VGVKSSVAWAQDRRTVPPAPATWVARFEGADGAAF